MLRGRTRRSIAVVFMLWISDLVVFHLFASFSLSSNARPNFKRASCERFSRSAEFEVHVRIMYSLISLSTSENSQVFASCRNALLMCKNSILYFTCSRALNTCA